MKLKQYQVDALGVLRHFLEEARIAGPKNAYEAITKEPEQAKRLGRYRGDYTALEALPGVPYVCLRLPTGGGKTILGAHAVGIARDAWIEKDHPVVLWLVPSNTIRLQTVEALKNTRHPYRQALDEVFEGRVRVFDVADFTMIRPHDIRDNVCVVVGTIQTLRVNNTEGRKVYAHNENMEPHFSSVPATSLGLEQNEGGGPKFSFANLLHIHRPLMIVDEAHNAVTGLTRDMQARVNPCAIIEFTATPRFNSNILHSVSAQELKAAEMIKLPIILAEHDSWQNAVNGAIASRKALADAAKGETDYIRPIVLFQAQPRNQEVTVEVLKKHLIEVEQIPEERIAVATGDQRELDGIDLFDPKTTIEYVITVEALKEGWDCSFAYVFCSVSRIQSATDVEQLLGRVLRMPYAKRRAAEPLNRAYAHVSEATFGAAASGLADKLVAMGFEEDEAKDAIEPAQGHLDDTGLFAPREKPKPVFRHVVPATSEALSALQAAATEGMSVTETDDGKIEIAVTGRVAPEIETAIATAIPEPERQGFAEAVRKYRVDVKDQLSPAERGEAFVVPRLVTEIQGTLEFADTDVFMEFHDWRLADHPARLDEGSFAIREMARSFEIDVDGNRVTYQFADEAEQLSLDVDVDGWTPQNLVLWLDRQLRQIDVHQSDLLKWLTDCIGHLVGPRKLSVAALMRTKFILARKLLERIGAARAAERSKVYQRYLFAPEAKVDISFDNGFAFRDGMYADLKRHRYTGRFRFAKHFLGADALPAFDGAESGEEFQCAQALDSLPQVKFWIRNVSRHPQSFWFPTASDKFYPDFVAQLSDGRFFVVEYKGALLAGTGVDDTNEKRAIGRLWESRSGGRGAFLVVEKVIDGRDMRTQMLDKIAGGQ
ncbi:DEAD/DEAH box helicase family protein [Rhodopseudomonas palustris]|uniref:DEAD/DEAH box helicase n=1 Tax=Rhodopseudomonas palustris TaxID=1076 RepID=UPI0021F2C226|nr:DEAD/DEAH box helicase family protein [Rhodopseudomonas palustris]UYO43215.1 DEAD/DEAH box helicase family protein [Rhodopseudomonas palustris]